MSIGTLRQNMIRSGNYENSTEVDEIIAEMKQRVAEGEDPEEVLYEEGFEPDFVFDLL